MKALERTLSEKAEEIWQLSIPSSQDSPPLRRAGRISTPFSIYDTDDTKRLITACTKDLNIDGKIFRQKAS